MNITPEQADQWAQEATDGPWEMEERDALMNARSFILRKPGVPGIRASVTTYGHNGDPELIAAAPELAQTIAGMRWQWGLERDYRYGTETDTVWFPSEDEAREDLSNPHRQHGNPRLVRRLVGPPEAIDGE